jgi:histidyl-tRNA synthetase
VGAEALGSEDPALDAESIVLLGTLLEQMEVRGVRLRLSSLGSSESRRRYRERLLDHLRANEQKLSVEVRERMELNPLRAFDSTDEGTIAVMREAPKLLDELDVEDAEHFATVCRLLDRAGVTYEIDTTLVRGLDYYTRTVFEFTSDALGAQSGVGGGGRYDGLVEQLGGPATPGIGWAAGIERVLLAGSPPATGGQAVDLYVGLADLGEDGSFSLMKATAFEILSEARSAGLTAQMEMAGRSLKGLLGRADRLGARYVAIVGEHETRLKDMQGGAQETLASDKVVHATLRGLRELG